MTINEQSGRGFNLNSVGILLSLLVTLGAFAAGVARVTYVITARADAINGRLDILESRLSRAELAAAEAKSAAAEAEKTTATLIREIRLKEEQDQNRELRQLASRKRDRR